MNTPLNTYFIAVNASGKVMSDKGRPINANRFSCRTDKKVFRKGDSVPKGWQLTKIRTVYAEDYLRQTGQLLPVWCVVKAKNNQEVHLVKGHLERKEAMKLAHDLDKADNEFCYKYEVDRGGYIARPKLSLNIAGLTDNGYTGLTFNEVACGDLTQSGDTCKITIAEKFRTDKRLADLHGRTFSRYFDGLEHIRLTAEEIGTVPTTTTERKSS